MHFPIITVPVGPVSVAHHILRQRGIAGLYRGITACMARDFTYGVYFSSYEAFKVLLHPRGRADEV